ncbi:MAG: hypothetical protein LHV68_02635 [Elusimicrobia bacterium]|nr:hypothetical protein [Candidatus Liberimonas magnetica]
MRIALINSLYLIIIFLTACGSKESPELRPNLPKIAPKQPEAAALKKVAPPRYAYTGYKYRDPFIALNAKGAMLKGLNDVPIPNIDSLSLKGILDDGKQKIAILVGGGYSFMLMDGNLFDSRRRLVNGITGSIKKDSVVIIDAIKKSKEIKLKEESK